MNEKMSPYEIISYIEAQDNQWKRDFMEGVMLSAAMFDARATDAALERIVKVAGHIKKLRNSGGGMPQ